MAAVVQCFEFHKAQYDKLPDQKGTLPDVKVARDPGNKVVWGTCTKIGWGCAACFTLTLFMTAYCNFPYPIYNLVCMINNSPAIFLNLEPGTQPKLVQAYYHFQLWTCMHRNRNPCNPLFHGQHG